MLPPKIIMFSPDGKGFIATVKEVQNMEAMMLKVATDAIHRQHHVSTSGDTMLHVASKGGVLAVYGAIKSIRINARWAPHGDVLIPHSNNRNIVFQEKEWKVPSIETHPQNPETSMRLFLGVFLNYTAGRPPAFNFASLIALNKENPGFHRLPLTNVYSDGKVCLGGDDITFGREDTLTSVWTKVHTVFQTNAYNADLSGEQDNSDMAAVFGFKDGVQQTSATWWNHCRKVNHEYYDMFSV